MIKKLYRREAQRRKHKDTQRDLTRNFAKLCEIFAKLCGKKNIPQRNRKKKRKDTQRDLINNLCGTL